MHCTAEFAPLVLHAAVATFAASDPVLLVIATGELT
jgi:hypothetical protein